MSALRAALSDQRGFTAAELLVVTAIIGLMLAGIFVIQQQGAQDYLLGSRRVEVQQNARVALELMIRELRSAQSVTAIPGAGDMTFVDENGATIQYQLAGTTLNRIANGLSTPLIGGVQTFTMTYFSAFDGATNAGTVTTVAANVRLVRIQLVTGTEDSVASSSWANQRAAVESIVRLRNV